jgi:hypothetical protein
MKNSIYKEVKIRNNWMQDALQFSENNLGEIEDKEEKESLAEKIGCAIVFIAIMFIVLIIS